MSNLNGGQLPAFNSSGQSPGGGGDDGNGKPPSISRPIILPPSKGWLKLHSKKLKKMRNAARQQFIAFGGESRPKSGKSGSVHEHNQLVVARYWTYLRTEILLVPSTGKRDEGMLREKYVGREVVNKFLPENVGRKFGAGPKPTWHKLDEAETQQCPDALVHEVSHIWLLPLATTLPEGQVIMDKDIGRYRLAIVYNLQKETSGEVQPMALENPLRRRMGLPPNRDAYDDLKAAGARCWDDGRPQFHEAKDSKGNVALYTRSARLMSEETAWRLTLIDNGILRFDHEVGWVFSDSVDARINARAIGFKQRKVRDLNRRPKK